MEFVENTVSPTFEDVWDTDDLDKLGDMSNSFIRLHMSNDRTMEELFEIRTKVEKRNPLVIKKIPYSGERQVEEENEETREEAHKILAMNTVNLSEVFIDQNKDMLPTLPTYDCEPKEAVMKKIRHYEKHLNM